MLKRKTKPPEWPGDPLINELVAQQEKYFAEAEVTREYLKEKEEEYERRRHSWSDFEEWRYCDDLARFLPVLRKKLASTEGYYRSVPAQIRKRRGYFQTEPGRQNLALQKQKWIDDHS